MPPHTPAVAFASAFQPPPRGLLVLHGNRLETLQQLLVQSHQRWPLPPLQSEVVLVQSHGAGEWFHAATAQQLGISAAARIELPARFAWSVYRQVLGEAALGSRSPLDREALVWRLLRLLPAACRKPGMDALQAYLRDGDPVRALQLAQRLADLYDQYQVYRADWLDAWAQGLDQLIDAGGRSRPLPIAQGWQPALWRMLLDDLGEQAQLLVRPQVQQRVLERLHAAAPGSLPLPQRVSLFGAACLAPALLQLLAAMARHCQVLVAVLNPCRFHWADIIEGRELLRAARPRQALRGGRELASVALPSMHLHAHPLLAAWGRQGRDFMRQLDAFEDGGVEAPGLPRVEAFDERQPRTLLESVQAAIRDLLPPEEHRFAPIADRDDSIQFHVAHGAQREVEVLHDRLLDLLARPVGEGEAALHPRDIVVMVPDIEEFAPAVRAVFAQYPQHDPRHIPFDIADLGRRSGSSLLLALEWLLGIGHQRVTLSEVCGLLEVPAVAARLGLDAADQPLLTRWMVAAGARWGLHGTHRASLGLQDCGEAATWAFALRRMLLGYASGEGAAWQGIEPLPGIGGLDAELVGVLQGLLDVLQDWWRQCLDPATPQQWARRGRDLLERCLRPTDEGERQALAAMHEALARWLQDCECAGFDLPLPLPVFARAWLERIDEDAAAGRFLAGGVTFCTMLPLRAIPFEVVCLLGMNEDAYPRVTRRSDFDLMAAPGQFRAGDRSRRDDDRYLMLEALLAARRVFSVSWRGRSERDNTRLAPSLLVSQLRDYLAACFAAPRHEADETAGQALLRLRTAEYPLQPFSPRHGAPGGPRTHAREWFATVGAAPAPTAPAPPVPDPGPPPASLRDLAELLRNPVRLYFRERLDVRFDELAQAPDDDEVFALDGLQQHELLRALLAEAAPHPEQAQALLRQRLRRVAAAGLLPLAGPGQALAQGLQQQLEPALRAWSALCLRHPLQLPPQPLRLVLQQDGAELVLDDRIDGLRRQHAASGAVSVDCVASPLLQRGSTLRVDRLLRTWVRMLGTAAADVPCTGYVIGPDALLYWQALPQDAAEAQLGRLLTAWAQALRKPLPWGLHSAMACAQGRKPRAAYEGSSRHRGDVADPYLERIYADFDALCADGRFESFAQDLFVPLCEWARTMQRLDADDARLRLPEGDDG